MARILVVEDTRDVNQILTKALEQEGHLVQSAYTGMEAMELVKQRPFDLILLDLMLPYKSGDQVLREIRSFSDVIVIVISAKELTHTKVELLKLGADDYITKPFDLDEVAARVESSLRRVQKGTAGKPLEFAGISLDRDKKEASVHGELLELTARELEILELLMEHPGKVYSKVNIYETVWGDAYLGDDRVVKVHMSNLRGKLKEYGIPAECLETVRGLGYRLKG